MARGVRSAEIELGASDKKLRGDLRRSQTHVQKWARGVKGDLARTFSGSMNSIATVAGFGGVAMFAQIGKVALELDERFTRLGINAGKTADRMAEVRKQVSAIAAQRGMSSGSLLGGLEVFTARTGDLDAGMAALSSMASLANATGSSLEDIAQLFSALKDTMGLTADESTRAFAVMFEGGRRGSVEIKDFAGEVSQLAGMYKLFGKGGVEGIEELTTFMQILAKQTPNVGEVSTQMKALMTTLIKRKGELRDAGINVDAGLGEQAWQIIAKAGGDETKLYEMLGGRGEAGLPLIAMMNATRAGWSKFSGLEAGGMKGLAEGQATFENSKAFKARRAWTELNERLTEKLAANMDKIVAAIEKAADVLMWVVENPLKSIGLYMGMRAGTGLGMAMAQDALTRSAEGAAGVGAGAVGGAAAGWLKTAAGVTFAFAGGVAIGTVIWEAIDKAHDAQTQGTRSSSKTAWLRHGIWSREREAEERTVMGGLWRSFQDKHGPYDRAGAKNPLAPNLSYAGVQRIGISARAGDAADVQRELREAGLSGSDAKDIYWALVGLADASKLLAPVLKQWADNPTVKVALSLSKFVDGIWSNTDERRSPA